MKTTKKVLAVLLSVLMIVLTVSCLSVGFTASAAGGTDGDIEWNYNGSTKTLTIRSINGSGNMFHYYYDTAPWHAYRNDATTIVIEDGVTSIGSYAFYRFSALGNVTIPASVTRIGEGAFGFGTGESARYKHVNITDLAAWNGIDFDSSDSNPLYGCISGLFLNGTAVTDLTLLSGVTSIGANAFVYCAGMKRITIPSSVTSIGEGAFYRCEYLESVTIPNGVTCIDEDVFSGCTSLTSVSIPDGVTSIGARAFLHCEMLTEIRIPPSVKTIGSGAFNGVAREPIGGGLTTARDLNVYITDLAAWCAIDFEVGSYDTYYSNPLYRSDYAAKKLLYLNDQPVSIVDLPDSASKIGTGAFAENAFVKGVKTGNGVQSIGERAFYEDVNLGYVTIGKNVKSIGSKAFADCQTLQVINYPGSEAEWNAITKAEDAFDGCPENMTINFNYNGISSGIDGGVNWTYNANTKALTVSGTGAMSDYGIPMSPWHIYAAEINTVKVSGVTSIGDYAFAGCSSLTSVMIPDSVTSIGEGAFGVCEALQTVTIPTSVTSIGKYAFASCDSLTSVTIPTSVTSIGEGVFMNCDKLETINYAGSLTQWNEIQFGDYVFNTTDLEASDLVPYRVAVVLPGFVNLPFGSDGLKDKDWYFDFSAYVAYMVEEYNLTESYPGEAEEFFRESLGLATLQFNPATEAIMYTSVDSNGKAEVFEMAQGDEYNSYRPFIKQYTAPVPTYTVTANAEAGGTATGGGTFNKGATATVKATPNSGYHFTGWYKGNSKVSGDASYSFTVTENVTLTAKFEKDASPSGGDNGGNNNQNANRCHWCGKTHDANFFQKIIGFFHNILAKIFGNKY